MFQVAEFADLPLRVVAADAVYDREYVNAMCSLSFVVLITNERYVAVRRAASPCVQGFVPWSGSFF